MTLLDTRDLNTAFSNCMYVMVTNLAAADNIAMLQLQDPSSILALGYFLCGDCEYFFHMSA